MGSKVYQVQCCQCNRIRRNGRWHLCDQELVGDARYSHGYCPKCLKRVMDEIHSRYDAKELELTR